VSRPAWRLEALTSARSDDAAALYRLFFPQAWERPWSSAEFTALLATPGCFGHLLVDAEDPAPRGLILMRVAADEAEILTIGVVPACRRLGGAARLLERAIGDSAARGAHMLFLDVAIDNEPARLFYLRHGFTVVGTRPYYYARLDSPAVDALVMRRDLVPSKEAFTGA
jgi:ribosomal-protein-alanine N-acetyltransferase